MLDLDQKQSVEREQSVCSEPAVNLPPARVPGVHWHDAHVADVWADVNDAGTVDRHPLTLTDGSKSRSRNP